MKSIVCLALSLIPLLGFSQTNQHSKAVDLVSRMTLEEKAQLVVGMGMKLAGLNMPASGPVVGVTMDKVAGAAGTTYAIPRLQVPGIVVADGPAGVRIDPYRNGDSSKSYFATAFPVGSLLASTWDEKLVQKVGEAMGNEVKEYGVDVLLAPALNIQRNPLGGRNFEYYSEDPLVSGKIAAAMVKGIQSNGVGTSVKHFAANNQETNRNLVNTIVSERALREIYLRGFEIVVKESDPWTVMSSYNKINGTYTSQDHELLTNILRKEWGYKGMVMSDWFGGDDPVAQMKAGNDLLMPGTRAQTQSIIDAVKNKQLEEKVLDINAVRVLELVMRSPASANYAFSNKPDLTQHAQVARQAAAEGMILLKNDAQALPFTKAIKTIAAFGNTSYDFISGGTGSGDVNEAYTVSLVGGLEKAGYALEPGLKKDYEQHVAGEKLKQPKKKFFFELLPPLPEMKLTAATLNEQANKADVAIITIGRNAGEFQDRKRENDFELTADERSMIKEVSAAFHAKGKKLLVILNVGGVVEIASWRNDADAILLAWQAGQEAGNAVADIMSGKVNPSGRLAITFPASYNDVPSAKSFPGKNLSENLIMSSAGFPLGYDSEVTYDEGIYTGYRYYQSFHVKPAYAFGYGLSYSQFSYSDFKLSSNEFNGSITATVKITNIGKQAGKEVAQLYISSPAKTMDKPEQELKGFAKTALLQPGASQTISFTIQPGDVASFDTKRSAWVAEPGLYEIKIGASSEDSRQKATCSLAKELIVETLSPQLKPKVSINEWTPTSHRAK